MRRLPSSIALRLTATLGVVAVLTYAGAGMLLHRALATELMRSDREELAAKVMLVKHLVDEAGTSAELGVLRHNLDDLLTGHTDLRVWLESRDGAALYGGKLPLGTVQPGTDGRFSVVRMDGAAMEAVEIVLPSSSGAPVSRIRVGIDTRPRERLLTAYRDALAAIGASGLLLTILLSAWATRRGLLPVKRLSAEAQCITPHSLTTRLSDADVDRELRGLVLAFNAVLDRLEAAYRQMEGFNADVAHELRTPLAVLKSGAQLMLTSRQTEEDLKEMLASQLEELDRVTKLVNDMLFLAHADRGERAQAVEVVDLGAAAERTIAYFEAALAEAGLEMQRRGCAEAMCNESLIRRAWANLLSNAIKHTASGRTVSLCIEGDDGRVRLFVENPGKPIEPEVARCMFDRFYRGEHGGSRSGPGHGLGLAIVRAVASMHGGGVFVEHRGGFNLVGFWLPR